MAKLFAFSGACNSGKTTTMKAVAEALRQKGKTVVILEELVRQSTEIPIDRLRANANEYLDFQEKITCKRIEQEQNARKDPSDTIYLADRALTDYMFYAESYIDKNQLDPKHSEKFYKLHALMRTYLTMSHNYTKVFQFEPITTIEHDKYRPKNLELSQAYESTCINRLNCYYLFMELVHINVQHEDFMETILKHII